ncbi:MAG: phosphate transport regulator [Rhodoferax sp.]|nr:phosphate transport regulator [Rhodoferax sp.]
MLKEKAVASLGQQSLLMPAWVQAALLANDRLKLYLTMLQSAAQHAGSPEAPMADWGRELAQAGLHESGWLQDLVKTAYFDDRTLIIPQLGQLLDALAADLSIMARPLCDGGRESPPDLAVRRDKWLQQFHAMEDDEGLTRESLAELTHGNRKVGDSFHILVMDLHKQLNAMAGDIATESLDGAHVWQIADADRPLIRAFMRGLHRTAPLKFSHPGLDTAVTRSGARLLIQNDIGTNDVHVLVIEVEKHTVSLTYSDLHAGRFDFFRQMLEEVGFEWNVFDPMTTDGLNAGMPYQVGKATLKAEDDDTLAAGLEAVGSRIVFVIDWNRARKRLQNLVRKPQAVAILQRSSKEEWGHMAWLLAGGERLVFNAMQAVDSEAFRVGDRLDEVLGESSATDFLLELMRISSVILRQQQPVALVADEARMLLARVLRQRTFEFDLLAEHAAYCHALALALCDALENGTAVDAVQSDSLVSRAKTWERQADHLLMDARQRAERQTRWMPVVELLAKADDVADALEEAFFIYSMTLAEPLSGLPAPVNEVLRQLADTTLAAIQDQVKAIEIARHVSERSDPADGELFLQTLWRMLRAERRCDELSRLARVTIVRTLHASPAGLHLASELATTIEKASDGLLAAGYALRQMVFTKTGMSA